MNISRVGWGGVIHRDSHKGDNGGKIQAMVTSHYCMVRQVVLLVFSDSCVKKNPKVCPVPMNIYIYCKSYGLYSSY